MNRKSLDGSITQSMRAWQHRRSLQDNSDAMAALSKAKGEERRMERNDHFLTAERTCHFNPCNHIVWYLCTVRLPVTAPRLPLTRTFLRLQAAIEERQGYRPPVQPAK